MKCSRHSIQREKKNVETISNMTRFRGECSRLTVSNRRRFFFIRFQSNFNGSQNSCILAEVFFCQTKLWTKKKLPNSEFVFFRQLHLNGVCSRRNAQIKKRIVTKAYNRIVFDAHTFICQSFGIFCRDIFVCMLATIVCLGSQSNQKLLPLDIK